MFRASCGATMIECRVSTSESPGATSRSAAWSSSSAGAESRPCGSISRSAGPAMNVVTSAMTTSIVKSVGEMRPRSSPMLSTISSVRPRVFMSAPTAAESRQLKPP